VLRIVPAYWLALTILAIYPGLKGMWGDAPAYYGFAQVYSDDTVVGGIGPAWSLCTEAAFYIALPVYAWAVARTIGSGASVVRAELALLGVLAAGSIVLRTTSAGGGDGIPPFALTLPALFAWFAVGMSLAVVSSAAAEGRLKAPRVPALACWAAALAAFLVLCAVLGKPAVSVFFEKPGHAEALFEFVVSGLVAGLIALPAVFGEGGAPRRALAHPAVAWLGLVSYGIYLWHQPLAEWLTREGLLDTFDFAPFLVLTVVTIAITVVIAALSYYGVERPILRLKEGVRRPRRADTAPVA